MEYTKLKQFRDADAIRKEKKRERKISLKFEKTDLTGVYIIEHDVHKDSRGAFVKTFHKEEFNKNQREKYYNGESESRKEYKKKYGEEYRKKNVEKRREYMKEYYKKKKFEDIDGDV